jgi:hypothetical protein
MRDRFALFACGCCFPSAWFRLRRAAVLRAVAAALRAVPEVRAGRGTANASRGCMYRSRFRAGRTDTARHRAAPATHRSGDGTSASAPASPQPRGNVHLASAGPPPLRVILVQYKSVVTADEDGGSVENFTRLGLFCRLFLGLFVGFFCVTAALFVRYMSAEQLPQVTVLQSKNASQALSGSAPAVSFTSAFPLQPTTPSLHTEEKTLIASSASTFVAFIAAAVTNFLSWRKDRANAVKEKRGPSR